MPTINDLPRVSTTTDLSAVLIPVQEIVGGVPVTKSAVASYLFGKGYMGSQGPSGSIGYVGSFGVAGYTGSSGGGGGGGGGYTGSTGYIGSGGFSGYNGSQGVIGYIGSRGNAGPAGGYTGSASTAAGYTGSTGGGINPTVPTVDQSIAYWVGTDGSSLNNAGNILVAVDGNNLTISGATFGVGQTPGNLNVAVGFQALTVAGLAEVSSLENVAVGAGAMYNNGTSSYCVAVGSGAMSNSYTGNGNVAVGANSLANNQGANNVAVGSNGLIYNVTGNSNISLGTYSLQNNINGSNNVGIGYGALIANVGRLGGLNYYGSDNIAIGHSALNSSVHGDGHIAIGASSLYTNTAIPDPNGYYGDPTFGNVGIGLQSLYNVTTGTSNIGIGAFAGYSLVDTGNNIIIGNNADVSAPGTTSEIVIGNWAYGMGASTAFIDGVSGVYNGANSANWTVVSDLRIKKNIVDSTKGLDVVKLLNVKNFNYKSDFEIPTDSNGKSLITRLNTTTTVTGVIAQDVQSAIPEAINVGTNGLLSVNADPIFWAMLNAIKELSAKVDALEAIVNPKV
jgi:hypothetical protein